MARTSAPPADERDWYKDAVIYELHVRSFYDSKGDGVGDFRGLATKLDYLHDLGVTALWLLPFYPSPLKDDGYDIASYVGIHPSYGDLRDFRLFLREAHRRGLRVITEMVLNHTSDQHPWFQRARRSPPGSAWRDFYVWSDTPERYREARIIFKDFESSNWSWDPVAKAYYWHRFYSHQPDLNFDNPKVREAMLRAVDFWMGRMGVDGLRLDAVPYLFEREGTNCENLPETHAFLRELRRHVDERHPGRMLLAEANQWPEDAVAYFGAGAGDECHTAFHFPLMPRMFVGIQTEDRFPIVDMLEQTPPIPETSQWVLFLRNHDELTLEMVSDEERDYMYRVYAQDPQARINLGIRRRLAPLLGNSRRKIELMTALLLSLPGTPVIYYGDELGMGDNYYLGDRNGVRTPMQWSPDRNAGFSRANSQRLYLPGDHRPRVPLRGRQRGRAAEQPPVAAVVDQAHPGPAQAAPGLRPGDDGDALPREPEGARVPAPLRRREPPDGRQPLPLRAARRSEPVLSPGPRAPGAVRPHAVPHRRRGPLSPFARAPRLLLVLPAAGVPRGRGAGGRGAFGAADPPHPGRAQGGPRRRLARRHRDRAAPVAPDPALVPRPGTADPGRGGHGRRARVRRREHPGGPGRTTGRASPRPTPSP